MVNMPLTYRIRMPAVLSNAFDFIHDEELRALVFFSWVGNKEFKIVVER